ncbi:glycosyltransferase family A protein [Flavobacterium tistrianum]|uniref:glycosyltransferase family A protein n=1 Tax=Flavobacterium tistrianum TaxID=1685414 RepID=UPI000DAD9F31|nr:glycosyltransferase family A protein [Flavobacterium tistrianum]KAF2342019.1 glycosyltransferase family 2 protein [Flavobacterium tistrianum]
MRIGVNPQKSDKKIILKTHHRVIVVVYIPDSKGFYSNSAEVFKLCIDSLVATIDKNCLITVVNNGSCKEVSSFLNSYLEDKKIDTLIHHNENIGKIDAMIGAARGSREKYITLSDSDILFVQNWQQKVEEVFENFKDVGSVSPIPVRHALFYGTSSVLKKIIFKRVKFKRVSIPENFKDYNRYLESINWDLEKNENIKWPIIEKNGNSAVIGSGHQILTITRDILFRKVPSNPSLTLVGNESEFNYVDQPIDKLGKLRLSTYNNYAFHMGNNVEKWMVDVQDNNLKKIKQDFEIEKDFTQSLDLFDSRFKNKLYNLRKKIIKQTFSLFYNSNLNS